MKGEIVFREQLNIFTLKDESEMSTSMKTVILESQIVVIIILQ